MSGRVSQAGTRASIFASISVTGQACHPAPTARTPGYGVPARAVRRAAHRAAFSCTAGSAASSGSDRGPRRRSSLRPWARSAARPTASSATSAPLAQPQHRPAAAGSPDRPAGPAGSPRHRGCRPPRGGRRTARSGRTARTRSTAPGRRPLGTPPEDVGGGRARALERVVPVVDQQPLAVAARRGRRRSRPTAYTSGSGGAQPVVGEDRAGRRPGAMPGARQPAGGRAGADADDDGLRRAAAAVGRAPPRPARRVPRARAVRSSAPLSAYQPAIGARDLGGQRPGQRPVGGLDDGDLAARPRGPRWRTRRRSSPRPTTTTCRAAVEDGAQPRGVVQGAQQVHARARPRCPGRRDRFGAGGEDQRVVRDRPAAGVRARAPPARTPVTSHARAAARRRARRSRRRRPRLLRRAEQHGLGQRRPVVGRVRLVADAA